MNQLWREWMFWAAASACVVAEVAIIISSAKSLRRARGKNAVSETVWAILPAIGLAWLLVATWGEVARSEAHQNMSMPMEMPMPASHS